MINPLVSSSQIRFKAVDCPLSLPEPIIQSSQENNIVNDVEGSGKVKSTTVPALIDDPMSL